MKDLVNAISHRFRGLSKSQAAIGSPPPPPMDAPATPVRNANTSPTTTNTSTPAKVNMSLLDKALPALPTSRPVTLETEAVKNDYSLFDMDKLAIEPEHRQWFAAINISIRRFGETMNPSHDYQHVCRIVSNAATILHKESECNEWARSIDPLSIWVACMIHDVSNDIYQDAGETWSQIDIIDAFLEPLGCPAAIRYQAAQLIAKVPYTMEIADEEGVKAFADENHAFCIFQDAVRLEGLGAVGVSRFPPYGDGNNVRSDELIGNWIRPVEERFAHYPRMMKTETGREMAEER
ncbi:hypothetical protein TUN199_09139 [Pyrenophora tritici-repentis]|nr:hypothetical protein Alg130_09158 [Pyrenophora tritici-repentis]KAI0606592.1 hypothetical protein TUN205_09156 [Pyrenophora tritici-repentis]KAI0618864.1 hypothetical protein TUN199_09139 [Pyrenophora tritici-repentis]